MKKYFRRYLWIGVKFLFMTVLGIVIYPFIYPRRRFIRAHREGGFRWGFLNSDEPYEEWNDYGDPAWRERKGIVLEGMPNWRKFFVSWRWIARNSAYNWKLSQAPNQGPKRNIKIIKNTTEHDGLTFCNHKVHGKQYATYFVGDERYFRYSFTTRKRYMYFPLMWRYMNVQMGASDIRYIYKVRWWKKYPE